MNKAEYCNEYEYIFKELKRECENCAFDRGGECINKKALIFEGEMPQGKTIKVFGVVCDTEYIKTGEYATDTPGIVNGVKNE